MSELTSADYRGDLDPVTCGCGAEHPKTYSLIGCDHPLCEVQGCHECLAKCDNFDFCGKRCCSEHLETLDGVRMCFACIAACLDEEEAAAEIAKVAA